MPALSHSNSYDETATYIDMVQTILESPSPALPADGGFSSEMADFVSQCLQKEPGARLPHLRARYGAAEGAGRQPRGGLG